MGSDGGMRASSPAIRAVPGGVLLAVRAVPRSSTAGLAGVQQDAVRVRLRSAPVEGAANEELIRVLAKAFGVPRSAVTIEAGVRSRIKRVLVAGVDAARAAAVVGR
jgi:uncharacterized protein (TIGR00251 family)